MHHTRKISRAPYVTRSLRADGDASKQQRTQIDELHSTQCSDRQR